MTTETKKWLRVAFDELGKVTFHNTDRMSAEGVRAIVETRRAVNEALNNVDRETGVWQDEPATNCREPEDRVGPVFVDEHAFAKCIESAADQLREHSAAIAENMIDDDEDQLGLSLPPCDLIFLLLDALDERLLPEGKLIIERLSDDEFFSVKVRNPERIITNE